jgi:protein-S-isoprenylcysteine O-methyltransferase Ste14
VLLRIALVASLQTFRSITSWAAELQTEFREVDMNNFPKWQNQTSSNKKWLLALGIGALIFPVGIPALLIIVLPQVDNYLGISSFYQGFGNIVVGVMAILVGGFFALWTIENQIRLASGTPFPMLPTQKLLIVGPFKYCRNPMTLGTIAAYVGISILVGSFSALIAVAIFATILISYLKLIEEKELAMRFGNEYIEYKKKTPFIIPLTIKKN